jgi:hypothetical protein
VSAHEHEDIGGFTDDPKAAGIIFSGVVGTLVLVVTILALQALVYQYEASENQTKNLDQQWTDRLHRTAAQEANLQRYRWVDKDKGVAGIPIDDAIALFLHDEARAAATRPRPQ